MRIATVTLNPAIDQTVRVDHFHPNTVNYAQAMQFDAGGKGVNVASFLTDGGFTASVTGFLGQDNVDIFEQFFASKHIDDQFVRIPGRTRIGVKIVDEANQQTTDLNMPGLSPPAEAVDTLFQTIERLSASCDWFVLSGTLPPGVPTTTYATLITQLKRHGKQVLLDTSRDALREGVLARPTIVKPNSDELQQLTGHSLTDEVALEQAARRLLGDGIQMVVVSMGERGAMLLVTTCLLLRYCRHTSNRCPSTPGPAFLVVCLRSASGRAIQREALQRVSALLGFVPYQAVMKAGRVGSADESAYHVILSFLPRKDEATWQTSSQSPHAQQASPTPLWRRKGSNGERKPWVTRLKWRPRGR